MRFYTIRTWFQGGAMKKAWKKKEVQPAPEGLRFFPHGRATCGGFLSHGGSPIAGWFIMENPKITWTWGYPISSNLHVMKRS
jgi:hypothetical protein